MAYIDCENCYHGEVCTYRRASHDKIVLCEHWQPTADVVEVETVSERIIRKQTETSDYWQNDVKQYRASKGYSNIEHDVDNFLRGYNEAVEDMLAILDERKVE